MEENQSANQESQNQTTVADAKRDQLARSAAFNFGAMIMNLCVVYLNLWVPTTLLSAVVAAVCGYLFVSNSFEYVGSILSQQKTGGDRG